MKFAEKLRKLRESAGMTQAQLAAASQLPLGSLRNYEQGQREPYWDVVFKLARALGVDCSAFADCVKTATEAPPAPEAPRAKGAKKTPAAEAPAEAKQPTKKRK